MALYEFKCENERCEKTTAITLSMMDEIPKNVLCEECGSIALRVWGNQSVRIPDDFKATNELCNGDHGSNLDYIKNRMKHGKRLSGKDKIYY